MVTLPAKISTNVMTSLLIAASIQIVKILKAAFHALVAEVLKILTLKTPVFLGVVTLTNALMMAPSVV